MALLLYDLEVMSRWSKSDIFKFAVTAALLLALSALFLPFVSEILLAAVFALAIEPKLGRWLQVRHLRWKISVAAILAVMFLFLATPLTVVVYKAYLYFFDISKIGVQNTDLFKHMASFRAQLLKLLNSGLQEFHLADQLDLAGLSEEALGRAATFIVSISSQIVYRLPDMLLSAFVFCVALYFFLAEGRTIKLAFLRLQLLTRHEAEALIRVLQRSSFSTVLTSLALGLIAATLVSLGAVFLEGGDFVVVFVITFVCSFIPLIGSGPVALVLMLYKFVMGEVGQATGFLVLAVVVGLVDNALRPYLISSAEDDLHPVVSLLALIGALAIFGMPGVFLGPVIASTALQVIPIFYPHRTGPQS